MMERKQLTYLLILFVFVLNSCSGTTITLPENITVDQANEMRDEGAFILDVRTLDEWNEVHIPDSTLIPLDELESRVSELPADKDIVVICRSGNRSKTGREILRKAGMLRSTSVDGGITQWAASNYPTVTGP